jgi:hypothetical protein
MYIYIHVAARVDSRQGKRRLIIIENKRLRQSSRVLGK